MFRGCGRAICNWYKTRYDVDLDPETEAIVTIGSKEGIAHLCLAVLDDEDTVAVPNPSYPIHIFGPVIAGSKVQSIALCRTVRPRRCSSGWSTICRACSRDRSC